MKHRPVINAEELIGGIFTFLGGVFAVMGVAFFLFMDPNTVEGTFDDPAKNHLALCGTFTVLGLVFFLVGIVLLITSIRKRRRRKALLQNGRKIYATVTGIKEDTSIEINNRHPYRVVCEYEDPYSGEKKIFMSESFLMDLSGCIGATVPVYLDSNGGDLYCVDFDPDSVPHRY